MIVISDNFYYDTDLRMYVLTTTGVSKLIDVNLVLENKLKSQDDAEALLKRVSRNVYTYFYNLRANRGSKFTTRKSVLEYIIFRNENNEVETLIEALLEQVMYTTQSGGDLMANEYENNGVLLSKEDRMALLISPVAKEILNESILGTKSKIGFRIPESDYRNGY